MANKEFNRYKRAVLKRFPEAKTQMGSDGKYFVSDGCGGIVGSEFMIPNQDTVMNAWRVASDSVKLTQHLNRTHPMKMEMEFDEKKFHRISVRNRKK